MKTKLKNYQIILLEIGIGILIYMIANTNSIIQYTPCQLYQTTGLLCPGCGGTRCIQSILKGDIVSAFHYHAIFTIVIIYLIICNVLYLINRKREKQIGTWLYPKYWHTIILAIIVIIYAVLRNL